MCVWPCSVTIFVFVLIYDLNELTERAKPFSLCGRNVGKRLWQRQRALYAFAGTKVILGTLNLSHERQVPRVTLEIIRIENKCFVNVRARLRFVCTVTMHSAAVSFSIGRSSLIRDFVRYGKCLRCFVASPPFRMQSHTAHFSAASVSHIWSGRLPIQCIHFSPREFRANAMKSIPLRFEFRLADDRAASLHGMDARMCGWFLNLRRNIAAAPSAV